MIQTSESFSFPLFLYHAFFSRVQNLQKETKNKSEVKKMKINTKAIIKYWKQSIGLHKSYLKTLEIDKLEDIKETQYNDLECLEESLTEINNTIAQIKDYLKTVEGILFLKQIIEDEKRK